MGQFLVSGNNGSIQTLTKSADSGATWSATTALPAPFSTTIDLPVVWNGSVYCVVSPANGACATSPDGVTWTVGNLPTTTTAIARMAWGGGQFVVVGYNSTIAFTSPDGLNWTQRTVVSHGWRDIAYGAGVFVAVDWNTTATMYSADGITWTVGALPTSLGWGQKIVWNGAYFICLSDNKGFSAKSVDGITWAANAMPVSVTWQGLAWNGTVWCAIAGRTATTVAATSTDGVTWTAQVLPTAQPWRDLEWDGAHFLAVSDGSATAAISADGVTWATTTLPAAIYWANVTGNPTASPTPMSGASALSLTTITGLASLLYGVSSVGYLAPITGRASMIIPIVMGSSISLTYSVGAAAISQAPTSATSPAVLSQATITAAALSVPAASLAAYTGAVSAVIGISTTAYSPSVAYQYQAVSFRIQEQVYMQAIQHPFNATGLGLMGILGSST